jgi:hypothetical protein
MRKMKILDDNWELPIVYLTSLFVIPLLPENGYQLNVHRYQNTLVNIDNKETAQVSP